MHPTIADIEAARARIAPYVIETPSIAYYGTSLGDLLPAGSELFLKLELLQKTGSFKARGAVNVVLTLSQEERAGGITAVSAGNHAVATAYAAKVAGLSAKVVMPKTANPYRVERCRAYGAEILLAETVGDLFPMVKRLQEEEGRSFVHPFEGPRTFEGTASVGYEFCRDVADLDAVLVPVGGGGLIAGISAAVKQMQPACRVYGIEPAGANGMSQSLAAGKPLTGLSVKTIADSLAPPFHTEKAFALVQHYVDDMVTVSDEEIVAAMRLSFGDLKLAVEPAGATALAGLLGPLRDRLAGQRVGLIVCGSNIDVATFTRLTASGPM